MKEIMCLCEVHMQMKTIPGRGIITVLLLTFLSFNLQAQTGNVLVVYFSRVGITQFNDKTDVVTSASLRREDKGFVGNTELLAGMVHDRVGGDLVQIKTVQTYPEKYRDTTDLALKEQRDGTRPALSTRFNLDNYDVIFLGYPNWWGTLPMALFTFMESYDFEGKTIIPFCTHEGSALGRSIQDLNQLAPRASVKQGYSVRGSRSDSAGDEVDRWLRNLGY